MCKDRMLLKKINEAFAFFSCDGCGMPYEQVVLTTKHCIEVHSLQCVAVKLGTSVKVKVRADHLLFQTLI